MNAEIQVANYWEHFKFAKDLALIYPITHPKRVEIELVMRDMELTIKDDGKKEGKEQQESSRAESQDKDSLE